MIDTTTVAPKNKSNPKKLVKKIVSYFFLCLFALIFLFPIYCLLIKSVMPDHQLIQKPSLFPEYITFHPYLQVFTPEYLWYFKNTVIVCLANILGVCFSASFCAYGLAKVHFKGKNVVFTIILSTILLPGVVTSIPLYLIYDKLHWTGTLLPLTLPIWFGGGAVNIFLVRQFIKGIPNSFSEAAYIDGASSFTIYTHIIIPLIKPILVYLAVSTFIGQWNDFQGPLLYVSNKQSSWTISLALYKNFANAANAKNLPNVQMAVGVLMMLPCVILFGFFQKELIEGVAASGIKA